MGIAELVPDMRKELERQTGETVDLTRRIVAVKEGSERTSDVLEV